MVEVHLRVHLGNLKAEAPTEQAVLDYTDTRRKAGRKNATINREVSLLRRSLTLTVVDFPRIPKLVENNIRKWILDTRTPRRFAR